MDIESAMDNDLSDNQHSHLRKLERARLLAEIEVDYQRVIEEAKQRHDNVYNTVFNENTEIDPALILEMQYLAQRQIDQEKKGILLKKLKRLFSFSSQPVMPFVIQTDSSGASSLTIPPGTISAKKGESPYMVYPPSIFKKEGPHKGEQSCYARHRKKINFLLFVTILLLIATGLIMAIPELQSHFVVVKVKTLES